MMGLLINAAEREGRPICGRQLPILASMPIPAKLAGKSRCWLSSSPAVLISAVKATTLQFYHDFLALAFTRAGQNRRQARNPVWSPVFMPRGYFGCGLRRNKIRTSLLDVAPE